MALVCYHGENHYPINQEKADLVLNTISDRERRKIINSIRDDFKTAHQISEETGLPKSTIYRKIRELEENKLLIISGRIGTHGKRESTYKSKIRKVIMTFDDDVLDVKIYTNLRN